MTEDAKIEICNSAECKYDPRMIVRNALDKSRDSTIRKIEKNKEIITKLNYDIEKILLSRNALLRDNIELTNQIVGIMHFLAIKDDILLAEFDKHNFDSDLVKQAVKQVRLLFFDDDREVYQKYNCVDIKKDDYSSYMISFVFSNSEREFSLNLPVTCIYSSKDIQDTEYCGGGLSISFYRNSNYIDSTNHTLHVDEFRNDIYRFITAKSITDFSTENCKNKKKDITLPNILSTYMNDHLTRSSYSYSYYNNNNLVYTYTTYD